MRALHLPAITAALALLPVLGCEPDSTRLLEESERGVEPGEVLGEAGGAVATARTGERHVVQSVAGEEPGESEIMVDGVVIASAPGPDDQPVLLDDGHTVVFVSGRTGVASLWRVDVDGTRLQQLTNVGVKVGQLDDAFVPPPARTLEADGDGVRYDDGYGTRWRVSGAGEATRLRSSTTEVPHVAR